MKLLAAYALLVLGGKAEPSKFHPPYSHAFILPCYKTSNHTHRYR